MLGLDIGMLMRGSVICGKCEKAVEGFWAEHDNAKRSTQLRANCHGKILRRTVGDLENVFLPITLTEEEV